MERDIKRAKGADEQPVATRKESILADPRFDQLEEEIRTKDALIAKLTKENEDLQQKLGLLSRGPVKKGAQTRYWRREEHERFLEALEKYGQRDVKNISAFVGTRSPTQVRTHAQKYFLKQRREETAQMKNANTMARKRRLISAASGSAAGNGNGAGMDEEEEEEEDDDDMLDDEEEEEEEDDVLSAPGSSSAPVMQVDTHESSATADDSNGGVPRRKSTRVTNAAAVIKLRTQDVVAHHSPAPVGGRGGAGKRAAPSSSTAATTSAASNGSYGASSSQSATNAKAKASGAAGAGSAAAARKGAGSPPAAATTASSYSNNSAFGSSSTGTTANNNPPPRPPSTLSALPGQHYGMHPSVAAAYGAYGAPGMYGAPGFRADIFNSPEEAAQFYKAVKMYERETDRTKVLMSIKEYFLPHRTIEEISNMVDMAFPTFDPNAGYNAALHPMYAQGRMYYSSDASGHSQLAGFSSGNGMHASSAHQSNQQAAAVAAVIAASQGGNGGKMDPAAAAYLSSNPALLGGYPGFPGMSMDSGDADFGPAPTHIESSSLASITDRMSEQMKSEDGSSQQGPSAQRQSGPSDHSSTASSSATVNGPAGDAVVVKKKEDDDDLMSELASLTDRSIGGGGMSGFLGGRPLALSPGVFGGGTGSTPLGFGMTPLGLPNSTPLSFMSPLGLNFATQSPINPYFNPQK